MWTNDHFVVSTTCSNCKSKMQCVQRQHVPPHLYGKHSCQRTVSKSVLKKWNLRNDHGRRLCVCQAPNAFMCVSPNALKMCVTKCVCWIRNTTEFASLAYFCSLRSDVFQQSKLEFLSNECSCVNTDSCLNTDCWTPKWTQNGPKMDPKWTQNGPKMDPEWTQTVTHMWTHLEIDSPRNEEFTQFCDFHHWNSSLCALFSHICAYKHIHQRIMLKCWYQKFDVQFQWFSRNPSLNVQYNNDSKQRYWSGGTNPTIVSYMTIVQSDIMEKIPQVWFSENWTPCSRNQRDLEVWSPAIYVVLNTSDHDSCTEAKLETHMKKNENKVE